MSARSVLCASLVVSTLLGSVLAGNAFASRSSSQHATAGAHLSLKNPGYLTVGSDTTYPPMESLDPRTHQAVGADVDLANALAKAMGLKGAKIITTAFDTIIPTLFRGNFDVIMSSMNDTPKRRKQIAFIDYMRSSEAIVVKKSSSIHADGYSQMCGHPVAVQTGTTEFDGLTAANKTCSSKIDIKAYVQDTAAFQAFASGHADAYTGDLPVAVLYVKQHAASLRLAGRAFGAGEDYGIGVLYRAKSLRAALAKALAKIRADGTYARILKKWSVGGGSL